MKLRNKVLRLASVCAVALAVVAACGLLAPPGAFAAGPVFTDLPESDFYYPFVNYLVKTDLIHGYPDGSFQPGGSLTRAEAAAMLARADKLDGQAVPAVQTFSDVSPWHWAYTVIAGASRAGLLTGYPDGTFRPEEPVSRAEACALLLRLTNMPVSGDITLSDSIVDVQPAHWARQQIAVALQAGLFTVARKNSFAPEVPATRAQMARGLATILNIDPERNKVSLICSVTPVKGKVTVTEPGRSPVDITAVTAVQAGAIIKTGAGSQAELNFSDGSGLRLDADTTMTITDARGRTTILKDGTPGTIIDYLKLDLAKGRLFGALAGMYINKNETNTNTAGRSQNNIQLAYAGAGLPAGLLAEAEGQDLQWWQSAYEEKVRVEVDMPWGVASVRGTFWMNEVGPGYNITSVIDGQVQVVSGSGQPVTVSVGQATSITSPGAPPTPPAPLTPEQQQIWQAVQDWVEGRVNAIEQNTPAITPPVPVEQQTGPEDTPPPPTPPPNIPTPAPETNPPPSPSPGSSRTITGTVSLPSGTAGSDINIAVLAEADGLTTPLTCLLTIPGGQSSANYRLTVPDSYVGYSYRVRYYVQNSYVQVGYYATGGTTAYLDEAAPVSVSGGSRTGVNLTLLRGYAISGVVSLPGGGPGNIQVTVSATQEGKQSSWGTNLTISSSSNPADYALYVPASAPGYGYRVKYSVQPGSGYVQQGFYANGATTAYYEFSSLVDVNSGDRTGVNLTLIRGKEISGTVSLPGDNEAPAGGIAVQVFAQTDPCAFWWNSPVVTIPAGASSAGYALSVPESQAEGPYLVSYQQTSSSSYAQRAYYGYDSITTPYYENAEWIYVSGGDRDGIDLTLLSGYTISGKVRLPEGQQASANLDVRVEAMLGEGTGGYPPNGWTDIIIPQGQNYAEYSLVVPAESGYRLRYSASGIAPYGVLQGYYMEDGEVGLIDVSEGSVADKDLTILIGSAISGTVSLPGGATAAGNISLCVTAVSSGTMYSGMAYVTIPNGGHSVNYSLVVPQSGEYLVNYSLTHPVPGYMQYGYYSADGTTLNYYNYTWISPGSQGRDDINLTLIPAASITGTVSLPAETAEEDIPLYVIACKPQEELSFYYKAHVVIPAGNSGAGYSLAVPKEAGFELFYSLGSLSSPELGYLPCGYYVSDDVTEPEYDNAALIDASSGDVTADLHLIPSGQYTPSAPAIISITAADSGCNEGLGSGDTVTIDFDVYTNSPPVDSKAAVDALIDFGQRVFGTDYAGTWTDARTLVLTVSDAAYGTLAVGDTLTIKESGGLKTEDGLSPASTASGIIDGTFVGTYTEPPAIVFASAVNGGGSSGVLDNGDKIIILFDVDTNQPLVDSKATVDALIDFQGKSFGTDYSGSWDDLRTLTITVIDNAGGNLAPMDVFYIKAGGNLRTADGLSQPSTAGWTIGGSF
ncbi:S-layer homology domain-containing protein [Pelotomaculum sp. PtaB.Bin117]|uniref:S-layer homology domain-containing protein n=1 Tax=Pelotomaculum sp. PtaB.Bin117 TaxID=1811694 RepID=UPI0009CA31A3|nr:S-layer homology domain-containing protein [Pelotomaculum sp. PtaB.Bin117]OPX89111.1 MAG: Cellulosome-anchoring protein precursor [Pelotomaculum sp. PtaB.Bin117]